MDMNDKELESRLQALYPPAEPDELSRARLGAARRRALDQLDQSPVWRWPALAVAASVLLATALVWQLPEASPVGQSVDPELIADLDLVLWLADQDG